MDSTMATFSDAELSFEARNWNQARESFQTKHKDRKGLAEFLKNQKTVDQAKARCVEAQKKAGQKYSKALGGILTKIETFKKLGDLAMKAAPETVGLAWMGIHLCLHLVGDDFNTFNMFSGAAADIIGILISCRVYGRMYGGHKGPEDFQELHAKVVGYIPNIYADIIDFSYTMEKHIDQKGAIRIPRGLFTSALETFKPLIDSIREHEREMSGFASTANGQLSTYYLETVIRNQGDSLHNEQVMRADLSMIKETLSSSMEINKIYMEHFEEDKKNLKRKTPFEKAKDQFEDNSKRLNATDAASKALNTNRSRRTDGTCTWIFALEKFEAWCTSEESSLLWVSGVGGLGKSILMSAVIDELQAKFEQSKECSVQYFFCAGSDDATRVAARIKHQLLHQLYKLFSDEFSDLLDKSNNVVSSYLGPSKGSGDPKAESQKPSEKALTFDEAYLELARILKKKVFLIIDTVDECTDRVKSRLLKTLIATLSASDVQLKIMICSRPKSDIVEELAGRPIIKVEDHNGPDIKLTAQSKLMDLPGLSASERTKACEAIVEKAKGLFRCVDPAIEFLNKPWQRPLERRLTELPDGLDNFYEQILRQTNQEYLELLAVGLTWIIFAQVNPTVAEVMDEYSHAYAEEIEGVEDDLENPYDAEMKNSLIRNQISIAGSNTFLEVTGNEVSARHTTVKEFFSKSETPTKISSARCEDNLCPSCRSKATNEQSLTLSPKIGHLRMAMTIFQHLNSPLFQRRYLRKEDCNAEKGVTASTDGNETGPASSANLKVDEQSVMANGDTNPHKLPATETLDDAQEIQDKDENMKELPGSPSAKDGEHVDKDNTHTEDDPPVADSSEYDSLPEHDDERSDEDLYNELDESNILADSVRPRPRYELMHWPYHLQMAEKHWSREERATSDEWNQLWKLVVKFVRDSSKELKIWQQEYMTLEPQWYLFEQGDLDDGDSLGSLHIAAMYGLTGLAEVLIDQGVSVTEALTDGRQPLWFAAEHGIDLLKLLLANGADPNFSKKYPPPFHRLLWLNPKLDGVKLMLDHGADCTILDQWDYNALHLFASRGFDVSVLHALLDHQGDINVVDETGETPLHKLLIRGDLPIELLNAFLAQGAGVNTDDKRSQRPLYEVCWVGNTEAARILLDHHAEINDDDFRGRTALHLAAFQGHLDTVKLLVDRGSSLSKRDQTGRTPFYFACSNGHLETARFLIFALISQGDNEINKAMNDGRTPLTKAAGMGHLEIVKLLLEKVDVGSVNVRETELKQTALHRAAYNGRTEVVKLLLQLGADAMVQDKDGKTPLALCGQGWAKDKSSDWEPVIQSLIDKDHETAQTESSLLFTAATKGSIQVIEKLLGAGAPPNQQDEHGWTPLQLARQYGNEDAVMFLSRHGAEVGSKPSGWLNENKKIHMSESGTGLKFVGNFEQITVLANHPIPAGIERYYYEIEISKDVGENLNPYIAIGFSTQPAKLDKMPGLYGTAPSWAWHGDDGNKFANSFFANTFYAAPYGKGDTIGCGVIYQDGVDGIIFYTRNGEALGPAFEKNVKGRLYPAIGMSEPAATLVNFGIDLQNRPFKWSLGNSGNYDISAIKAPEHVSIPVAASVSGPA